MPYGENVELLLSDIEIARRVRALGDQISLDYREKDLLLVGILKGSFIFLADLAKCISIPAAIDFVTISSYGSSTKSSGAVKMASHLTENVENRHVLIVEDIVDTGWTLRMSNLIQILHDSHAASVRICTLLDKPSRREVDVKLDYIGFEVADRFVVGYGLDFNGFYRNLPYIGVLKEEACQESPVSSTNGD